MRATILKTATVAAFIFAASATAQEAYWAYVPFRILNTGVNIQATVKATQAGKEDVVATTTNGYATLVLPFGDASAVLNYGRAATTLNVPAITQSRGNITLRLPAQAYQKAEVALYSVNGKRILNGKAAAMETASNISRQNVAAGVYMLKVSGTNGGAFATRLTHGGGDMKINVAFSGESASQNRPSAKSAAAGDWNITISAEGYVSYSYTLSPISGVNPTQEITLQVTNPNAMYTITFNANGGSGTFPPAQDAQAGTSITLPYGFNLSMGEGFTFGGWNTESSGTGANYNAGSSYALTANITLYAKWNAVVMSNYTITFSANGGSGTPPNIRTIAAGSATTLPDADGLTKLNFNFGGWNTNIYGRGTNYNAGSSYTPTGYSGNITLYANWAHVNVTTFVDSRDNKTYKKVSIGTRSWMAENLNYNADGSVCLNNSEDSCANYGRLYNWATAMGIDKSYNTTKWNGSDVKRQGVCPIGWHIPNDAEWTALTDYVGGIETAGTKLKFSSGWYSSNSSYIAGTDDYGWSALPGGYGYSGGSFSTGEGRWWSATEYVATNYAWYRDMSYGREGVGRHDFNKTYLYSVRCVED